jgi:uracil-DNA glycosylase family 4
MMIAPVSSIPAMNLELKACVSGMGFAFDCGAGGKIDATIAIVAEAPGEREVQQRVPLIGGSGKYLWDVLRKDKLTRNDVYITNVVKRKLVSAADGYGLPASKQKITITKQERVSWQHILLEELSRLPKLEYVIALGNFALEALVGVSGITDKRGSVFPVDINGQACSGAMHLQPSACDA